MYSAVVSLIAHKCGTDNSQDFSAVINILQSAASVTILLFISYIRILKNFKE
jgi:hypothetical protein